MVRPLHAALAGLLLASAPGPARAEPDAPPQEPPVAQPPVPQPVPAPSAAPSDAPSAAPSDAPPAAPSDAAAAPSVPPSTPALHPLDGPRRALALGWHGASFWSHEGSQYSIHSLALSYLGSTDRSGSFVHVTLERPIQARQDGRTVNVSTYYDHAVGLDLLLGWQWRRALDGGGELEAGPGLHADLLFLAGKEGYFDFSALQLGLGGEAIATWPTPWRLLGRRLRLGAVASLAVDLWDPLRDDDLRVGVTARAALVAAFDRE